ncbi:hypothetical protein GTU79_19450 [Sodalis ligni]|uniref:hypothetical protein n=1 Tax=Sodalis ligni TaxID=2697027 RepID=UPI00194008B9|nr:hypothetical protein [Sodalis ligni]QWA09518.1 hypothetical protein GTU79_19450 [Sodalis ligni]
MHTGNNIAGKISFYASAPDVDSARPLDFLKKLDAAESELKRITNEVRAQLEYGETILIEIGKAKHVIDESVLSLIDEAQEMLSKMYHSLVECQPAVNAGCEQHDNLPVVLEEAIQTFKEIFDQQESIRWAVMEHNVDMLPKGKSNPISSSEEIDAFFTSL